MMERTGNLLLDQLSDLERARVMERIEPVELPAHKVLAEPGRIMRAAYFPTDGVVSMVTLLTTGASVEAATVGKEGMAGVDLFLGGQGTENIRIICQVSGRGWSMDAGAFRQETEKSEEFRRVLERYARTYLVQATQSAACNSAHMVEQRLAKWFLLLSDWLDGEDFDLTHEFVANLLGVYRPSVTVAAGALQRAGLIEYKRGRVSILDRTLLHEAACECYDIIRRAYDQLRLPLPGDGPGAVLRLAALIDSSRANMRAGRGTAARAAGLVRCSASLGIESSRELARAQRLRAERAARVPAAV